MQIVYNSLSTARLWCTIVSSQKVCNLTSWLHGFAFKFKTDKFVVPPIMAQKSLWRRANNQTGCILPLKSALAVVILSDLFSWTYPRFFHVQHSYCYRIPPLQTEKKELCFTDDAIFKSTPYVTVSKSKFASPSLFEFQMKSALSSSLFSKQKHK